MYEDFKIGDQSDMTLDNIQPDTITFNADNYVVEKRMANIIYNTPLFIEQFHTLIFTIDGQEYRYERKG